MRILLVEDEPDLRTLFTRYLEREGYSVCSVENGYEGFQAVKTWMPDLVISDIQMPVWDGHVLLTNMQSLPPPQIPVVFISGYAGKEEMDSSTLPNLKAFLAKPFKPKELLEVISSILNS